MGNFSTNSFPTYRWDYDSDTGDKLDDAFGSIDAAIRHLFGLSVNSLTRAFTIADNGVVTVQHSIGIGTSKRMIDILDVIPAAVGPWEDLKLATVHAIRTYVDGGELLAANVDVDTSNFNYILSAADVNVQLALDTIDDHLHDERYSQIGHNHDSRYYTETEINNLLNLYLPLTAGSGKRLTGNLHIGGFNDPGIFIGPESLPYFYTHIYDIGAYSYYDCFSGNNARLLINPHPNGSAGTPPAGYMPGWGPNASIFKSWIDLFAETNTTNEVALRIHPGVGLRDGSPSVTILPKLGAIRVNRSGGSLRIDDQSGGILPYEVNSIELNQLGITRATLGSQTRLRLQGDGLLGVESLLWGSGLEINPYDPVGGKVTVSFSATGQASSTGGGFRFFDDVEIKGNLLVPFPYAIKTTTTFGFPILVATIGPGNRLAVGDSTVPLDFYGNLTRPTYNGGDLALYSDISMATPGAHTHPYNDYVSEVVSNGDPITPEVLFDLDGDVVTIDVVTARVTGSN